MIGPSLCSTGGPSWGIWYGSSEPATLGTSNTTVPRSLWTVPDHNRLESSKKQQETKSIAHSRDSQLRWRLCNHCRRRRADPKAPKMNALALTAALKEESLRLGFDLAGATPAVAPPDFDRFRQWLADGYAGQMQYLDGSAGRLSPSRPIARRREELLMLAVNYRTVEPAEAGPDKPGCRGMPGAPTTTK